jgi:hypothetical protein
MLGPAHNPHDHLMKPAELFAVYVRVIGLGLFFYELTKLFALVVLVVQMPGLISIWPALDFVLGIAVSIWTVRGAPGLVRFAYPSSSSDVS